MRARRKNKRDPDLLALRRACGLTQSEFWGKVGISQAGGSRYEHGQGMARPVALLVDLLYVRAIDTDRFRGEEMRVLACLQQAYPDLYARLQKIVRERNKQSYQGSQGQRQYLLPSSVQPN